MGSWSFERDLVLKQERNEITFHEKLNFFPFSQHRFGCSKSYFRNVHTIPTSSLSYVV